MVKIDDFHVQFDQKWAVYAPGSVVSGTVTLKLSDKVFCDTVQAHFYGAARVFWIEKEIRPPNGLQSVVFSAEKVYFDEKEPLWQDKKVRKNPINDEEAIEKLLNEAKTLKLHNPTGKQGTSSGLKAGKHSFQFSFRLPGNLPTSFDASHSSGWIRYSVKVGILQENRVKHFRKEFFTVVRQLDLNSAPKAGDSNSKIVSCPVTSTLSCCTSSQSEVSLMGTVQQMGYVPGEKVLVSGEVEGISGSVKMRASLVQHVTCYAESPEAKMKESFHTISSVSQERNIPRGQSWLVDESVSLMIPAVVPSFSLPCLIEVDYSVKLELFVSGATRPSLTLFLPVMVGTIPLSREVRARRIPPPRYEDNSFEAPPSYEESILGRTETQNDMTTDYLPRYAVFHTSPTHEAMTAPLMAIQ